VEGSKTTATAPSGPGASRDANRPASQAGRIALFYALAGTIWILGSDYFVLGSVAEAHPWVATVKGLTYIAVTAAALFYVVQAALRREHVLGEELRAQALVAHNARGAAQRDGAFIEAVLDGIEERIFVFTADGRIRRANAAGWRMLGRAVPPERVLDIVEAGWPEQTRTLVRDNIAQVIETGLPVSGRVRFERGGRTVVMEYTDRPFVDPASGRLEVLGIARDVTEAVAASDALARKNRILTAIVTGLLATHGRQNRHELAAAVARALVEEAGFALACISEVDDGPQSLRLLAASGALAGKVPAMLEAIRTRPEIKGPIVTAIRSRQPTIWNGLTARPEMAWGCNPFESDGLQSAIVVPMMFSGRLFGILSIYSTDDLIFDDDDIAPLVAFADQLGRVLTTLDSYVRYEESEAGRLAAVSRLNEALIETVGALATVVEVRDPYTAGHQRKVSTLAVAIAEAMGWSERRVEGVRIGALLHDIGKIAIPAELLTKPGRLTAEEFALIKTHAARGGELLRGIRFDWPILEMVTQHHERLDGSGYPLGLKGEEIAEEAKVLAVADVTEAMLAYRPYRPAIGLHTVVGELERGRGRLYDGEAVDTALRLIRERGTAWFQEAPEPA
jgi:putative nucleotidyltransferase with HDIG domain/PAS domain S-box-containing protein